MTAIVIVATAGSAREALAQPEDEARARTLFEEGVALLEDSQFAAAISKLRESVRLRESPPAYYNLGLASRGAGRYRDAVGAFERFLALAEERHQELVHDAQELLTDSRAAIAHVVVTATGQSTSVRIDQESIGARDGRFEIALDPGTHIFEASRPGYSPNRREVTLARGGRAEVAVNASATPLAGRLAIQAVRSDATIRLDGRVVGEGSYSGRVAPGHHRIELLVDGRTVDTRQVNLVPGSRESLTMSVPHEWSILEQWWFWAGGAVLLTGAAIGIYFAIPPERDPLYQGSLGFIVEALERR